MTLEQLINKLNEFPKKKARIHFNHPDRDGDNIINDHNIDVEMVTKTTLTSNIQIGDIIITI